MHWANVGLIWRRELCDQLRDRRTIMMVAVLPLFMYPLLGASLLQLAQFLDQHPSRVVVAGVEAGAESPIDWESGRIRSLAKDDSAGGNVRFVPASAPNPANDGLEALYESVRRGSADAAVILPPKFAEWAGDDLAEFSEATTNAQPVVVFNSAREPSQLAAERVRGLLGAWKGQALREKFAASEETASLLAPLDIVGTDVAAPGRSGAAAWSRLLPFLVLLWALTGAFYPAIDLCAGEKERGTLETLLASPAGRAEIVWGKLAAVATFSIAAALLNVAAFATTGSFVAARFSSLGAGGLAAPPLSAFPWLASALIPASLLFSALCLALAAFAKSTKEGQYYLMPLLAASAPLMLLPMSPGAELSLGTSLVPLTGLMLLVRTLIEGGFWQAAPYLPPVCLVTAVCCAAALRWAIDQFSREEVLFRAGERFQPWRMACSLLRDRRDVPTPALALFAAVLILTAQFFLSMVLPAPSPGSVGEFLASLFTVQAFAIAAPPLALGWLLTKRPAETFRLRRPPLAAIPLAVLLAVAVHPFAASLQQWVMQLYPLANAEALASFGSIVTQRETFWVVALALSLTPAVCEELAFRGFLLRGLERPGRNGWAIVASAVLFGAAHGVIQQSVVAAALGLLLGYLAIATRSILPCVAFHATHNGLMLTAVQFGEGASWLQALRSTTADGLLEYNTPVLIGGLLAAGLLTSALVKVCRGADDAGSGADGETLTHLAGAAT